MARRFQDEMDQLLELISWAEGLVDDKGNPANSFCLVAMQRFNREMATYLILHKQQKCKSKKPEKVRSELLKKGKSLSGM